MFKAILVDINNVLLIHRKPLVNLDPANILFLDVNEYFTVNSELITALKATGVPLYAFTGLSTLLNNSGIKAFLAANIKQVFSEYQLGLDKQSVYAYEFIAKNKLGLKTEQVLFIDDGPSNIEAAKSAGMATLLYSDNAQVLTGLKNML